VSEGIRITVPVEVADELLKLIEDSMGAHMDRQFAERDEIPWFKLINRLKAGIKQRNRRNAETLGLTKSLRA
jgi:hypothetical protein